MAQALARPKLTFEEYIDLCNQTNDPFELVQGELHPMNPPTVLHYRIAKFLERFLDQAIEEQFNQNEWETFRDAGQRTELSSSRLPDVAVVSKAEADQLLNRTAIFQSPGLLVIEIVSPSSVNEDYDKKLKEYQALGIPEYWVVDPEGLGAARYIGDAKLPTLSVYRLIDDKYQARRFRGDELIESSILNHLNLTANQVFAAGKQQ